MQRSELTPAVRNAGPDRRAAMRTLRELRSAACLMVSVGVVSLCSAVSVPVAHAQSNPRQLADANKSAMEQFNNLEVEASKASLEKAARNGEKNGIRGPALARTYSNLAVVLVGGMGDMKGATAAFQRALGEDPNVEPDPIVATPEVMQAFAAAKRAAPTKSLPLPEEEEEEAPAAPRPEPEGNLDHTPVTEQLVRTAVPVFVRKQDDLEIDKIKIAYRSTGMPKPRSAEMRETEDGYSFLIPCTDVFAPMVEYFIAAVDAEGATIGTFGSAAAPVAVNIVSSRTEEAPSLPGQEPPAQCRSADEECPPGMPGCEAGGAGLGESCSDDSDCGAGMSCRDDSCSMEDGDDEEDERPSRSSSKKKGKNNWYVDFGIGVAMTAVGSGRAADRVTTEAVLDDVVNRSGGRDNVNYDVARQELAGRGWDCQPQDDGVGGITVQGCTVAVNPGGIVPVPVLNFALGYHLTDSLVLAGTARFQLARGEGPMAGVTVGARGEYYLTKPSDKGFKFGLAAGFSLGQIQARPPAKNSEAKGPFATNANVDGIGFILNAGVRAAYMFTPNLGVQLTPMLNLGMPNLLFALDLSAGIATSF